MLSALAQHAAPLAAAGVAIEDKGLSLALHYRTPADRDAALRLIDSVMAGLDPAIRRCGASAAVFVGDDVNGEPVFEGAAPHWLTVRVDDAASHARFGLAAQADMIALIDAMLTLPSPPDPL